ncbi:PEGA domain-containing protein [Gynurincola endophyticus]|jgi:hypothetical protein|uniref:PEGA domain-containing protein n=1 Tax=Gynurincola endophyticus TaxID=2479004 RepID=UPI000F8F4CCE|nr:PEGA domain-containing protein [Gynurincola endophyticus]
MTKYFLKIVFTAVLISLFFTNCATIVSKSSYPLSIDSSPSGASVTVTNKKQNLVFKGETPATVVLSAGAGYFSKAEYLVTITQPGYQEQVYPVIFKLNGWYFGNILIGGFLGFLVIDPISGAMWKLSSPPIYAALKPETVAHRTPSLQVVDINSLSEEMKSKLIRIK